MAENITQLLLKWSDGDQGALDQLMPLVYNELRQLARSHLRRHGGQHSMQPTALVNEAYLRLIDWKNVHWQNRAHFFGISARLMRRILVDHARRYQYQKRAGHAARVSFDDELVGAAPRSPDLVALDDALNELSAMDARKGQIVELRFFGGLSVEETAEVLKISSRTWGHEMFRSGWCG